MSETIFAYGSNMCRGRLLDYNVHPEGPGRPAELRGYVLRLNKVGRRAGRRSGKGNVEQCPGETVWGVLYSIPDDELAALDKREGSGYRRVRLRVESSAGPIDAWVHVAVKPSNDASLRPYSWYKRFIVEGARSHGLPADYIAKLEAIDAVDDPDRAWDQNRRSLTCPDTAGTEMASPEPGRVAAKPGTRSWPGGRLYFVSTFTSTSAPYRFEMERPGVAENEANFLFALPEYNQAFGTVFGEALETLAEAKSPVLRELVTTARGERVRTQRVTAPSGDVVDIEPKLSALPYRFTAEDVTNFDLRAFVRACDVAADALVDSKLDHLLSTTGQIAEVLGQVGDAAGQPFGWPVLLKGLEQVEDRIWAEWRACVAQDCGRKR
jgi:cation transport regulator ChaC